MAAPPHTLRLLHVPLERLSDVLNWNRADKCALVAALTLPFVASYLALGRYLVRRPHLVPYLDQVCLQDLVGVVGWVAGAWVLILALGLALRKRFPESSSLVYATVQLYSVSNAYFVYCIGPYTSPLWLVLLGAGMIGFVLFGRREVLHGIASLLALGTATTAAERWGLIPYAPLLARQPYVEPGRPADSWMTYTGGVALVATLIMWALFAHVIGRWRAQEGRLRELSTTDELTQINNRRFFMKVLRQEFDRALRYRTRLACVMVDLDHFKRINDNYGHLVGDQVLLAVAAVLRDRSRKLDVVARYGGEEFVLLLPQTDAAGAWVVAERYRRAIEETAAVIGETAVSVTASLGVACYPDEAVRTTDDLLRRADGALYRAKEGGRNQVVLANGTPD